MSNVNCRATGQAVGNRTWVSDASSVAGGSQGGGGLTGVPRRWPATGTAASSGNHGAGYVCRRCGKAGHFLPNCPTNGDPSYDKQPPQKLMNTSTGSRKIVATLEGIETKNKTVTYCIEAIHNRIPFACLLYFDNLHHMYLHISDVFQQLVP